MSVSSFLHADWLQTLGKAQPVAAEMLGRSAEEQRRKGYFHTLREICQQPSTWIGTAERMLQSAPALSSLLQGIGSLTLSGSGSSDYAGNCVRNALQCELDVNTQAIPGGTLLTEGSRALPIGRPGLMVSLARSGDSPESVGALGLMLKLEPAMRHLVLTCNQRGRLATTFRDDPRVMAIMLDEQTNDKSLVMTSSFTNLVLAARFLGLLEHPERYRSICDQLSRIASELIVQYFGVLADVANAPFTRALFLGTGSRFAGARESALKMLEMTAGRIGTMCETYLGLRHGPMTYVHQQTLVVCFLSSDPTVRSYESDLLRELDQKTLGLQKVIVGERIPIDLVRNNDVAIECAGLSRVGDDNSPVIDVIVGQLLAFFRCLKEQLRPDAPSEDGVISRVVQPFALHYPEA